MRTQAPVPYDEFVACMQMCKSCSGVPEANEKLLDHVVKKSHNGLSSGAMDPDLPDGPAKDMCVPLSTAQTEP